jgi:DNA-binding NtrC family response regulator
VAKILIVGENPRIRELLDEELAGEGHNVVSIGNPALLREVLITLKPDLVLLGFHLKGMDEWDASMEIKRQAPHLPVLTFTAYGLSKKEIKMIMRSGYEIKSFPLEILKQKVSEAIRQKPVRGYTAVAGPL